MSSFDASNIIESFETRDLWRSIPTCHPTKPLFWPGELSQEEQALAHALADTTAGIDAVQPQKDRWHQYGDHEQFGEFCFDVVKIESSRFTDGSFPVWYGGNSQEVSKAEVTFHQWRQARKEFTATKQEKVIHFQRALCAAHVKFKTCLDIRKRAAELPEHYMEDGPPYPYCNQLAHESHPFVEGIRTLSRRWASGEVVAVFARETIVSSVVKAYWDTAIDKEGAIKICGAEVRFQNGWMNYL